MVFSIAQAFSVVIYCNPFLDTGILVGWKGLVACGCAPFGRSYAYSLFSRPNGGCEHWKDSGSTSKSTTANRLFNLSNMLLDDGECTKRKMSLHICTGYRNVCGVWLEVSDKAVSNALMRPFPAAYSL